MNFDDAVRCGECGLQPSVCDCPCDDLGQMTVPEAEVAEIIAAIAMEAAKPLRRETGSTRRATARAVRHRPTTESSMTSNEALKPCPFCGGTDLSHMGEYIACGDCEADGPFTDELDAADKWNTRSTDTPVCASTEEVRTTIEPLLRFHETGGHEGDGSDERLAAIRNVLSSIPEPLIMPLEGSQ